MNYWLLKSEGACYSIDDLKKDKRTDWTGIRNFQARNYMRDGMKPGDLALFYHSSGTAEEPSGVYGVAKIVGPAKLDKTALDPKDEHYDAKVAKAYREGRLVLRNSEGTKGMEGWVSVQVEFVKKLAHPVYLDALKRDQKLSAMLVLRPGQRLSVMPVAEHHFQRVVEMGK
jgi:predicted RNA-binding protein with PUA-like domain